MTCHSANSAHFVRTPLLTWLSVASPGRFRTEVMSFVFQELPYNCNGERSKRRRNPAGQAKRPRPPRKRQCAQAPVSPSSLATEKAVRDQQWAEMSTIVHKQIGTPLVSLATPPRPVATRVATTPATITLPPANNMPPTDAQHADAPPPINLLPTFSPIDAQPMDRSAIYRSATDHPPSSASPTRTALPDILEEEFMAWLDFGEATDDIAADAPAIDAPTIDAPPAIDAPVIDAPAIDEPAAVEPPPHTTSAGRVHTAECAVAAATARAEAAEAKVKQLQEDLSLSSSAREAQLRRDFEVAFEAARELHRSNLTALTAGERMHAAAESARAFLGRLAFQNDIVLELNDALSLPDDFAQMTHDVVETGRSLRALKSGRSSLLYSALSDV